MPVMTVEIWSDVVCPWCYIGKRRFEHALEQFAHGDQVAVVWRSFELDPHAPSVTPGRLDDMLAQKMGVSRERAAAMNAQVTALAAEEGLDYRLDQARHSNTFDAHRLIHLADEHGVQGAAKERLLHAYFSEGKAIGDTETLVALGVELGLNADDVRAALGGDAFASAVRADEQRAQMLGITGVPFFVLDGKYGVSGAQPTQTFLKALTQAWSEAQPQAMHDTSAVDEQEG